MPRRSAVAGTALALLVAATGCGAKDGPESTRPAAAAGAAKAGVMHHISIDYAAPDPGVTHEQAIRAMVQPPAVKGYVLGTVTSAGTVVTVDEARFPVECTDYDFTVTRFVGPDPAPYSPGAKITLRIPGGGHTVVEQRHA
ncbi:MAG: hypothetical protein QOI20_2702 [Acidimicrobiaceae bacterium]|jgi:hypothetical protein|nr:hypothetical protein [Acidimicrobiaceae bacterium]